MLQQRSTSDTSDAIGKGSLALKRLLTTTIVLEVCVWVALFFLWATDMWVLWTIGEVLSLGLLSMGHIAASRRNRALLQVYAGLTIGWLIFVGLLSVMLVGYLAFFVTRTRWLGYCSFVLVVATIVCRIGSVVQSFRLANLLPLPQPDAVALRPITEAQPLTQAVDAAAAAAATASQQLEEDQLPLPPPAVAPTMVAVPPYGQQTPMYYAQPPPTVSTGTPLPPAPLQLPLA